jgi:hypothetical protein
MDGDRRRRRIEATAAFLSCRIRLQRTTILPEKGS